jgi:hypothetical protein
VGSVGAGKTVDIREVIGEIVVPGEGRIVVIGRSDE